MFTSEEKVPPSNKGGMQMLRKMLDRAKENDEKAIVKLIEHFYPLMKKYAMKLEYEDAYEDMVLWFIELIRSDKLALLQEEVIVSYIHVSVTNYYNKKIGKILERKKEVVFSDLSERYLYLLEVRTATKDNHSLFEEWNLQEILNESECMILKLFLIDGYSCAEIARVSGKSRQAINQQKKRALKKLKEVLHRK